MYKKIIYSTVIYDCKKFDIFLEDYLESVFGQTDEKFELLILIDNADEEKVKTRIDELNYRDIAVHVFSKNEPKTPIQLRKDLIDLAYQLDADILVFSDFDENVAKNRIKEIRDHINAFDFVFNDFYIVDSNLNRVDDQSFFFRRNIPKEVRDWHDVKSYNFIGLGSLAVNLKNYDYGSIDIPDNILALDWFLATRVLVDGGKGLGLATTYANYRQHDDSFVGFDFGLNEEKLTQGLKVKEDHYKCFKEYNQEFYDLYEGILDLKLYIDEIGKDCYIKMVNSKFDTSKFCWWENIKLRKEICDDI